MSDPVVGAKGVSVGSVLRDVRVEAGVGECKKNPNGTLSAHY